MKIKILYEHFGRARHGLQQARHLTPEEKQIISSFFRSASWHYREPHKVAQKNYKEVSNIIIPLYQKFLNFKNKSTRDVDISQRLVLFSLKWWKRLENIRRFKRERAAKTIQRGWRNYFKRISSSPPPNLSPASRVKWIVSKQLENPAFKRTMAKSMLAPNMESLRLHKFASRMRSHPNYRKYLSVPPKTRSPLVLPENLHWVTFPTGRKEATHARTGTRYVYYPSNSTMLVHKKGELFPISYIL